MAQKEKSHRKEARKKIQDKQLRQQRRQQLIYHLKPLIIGFVVWFALIAILRLPFWEAPIREWFVSITTHTAYYLGKLLFLPITMTEPHYLSVKGFPMMVVMECTAYNFYLFALVLTLFARWPIRHKFISLGIFLVFIFLFNNLRFFSMGYLGSFRPDLFHIVHDTVWNIFFGFLMFGLWAWRELMARKADIPVTANIKQ